jgi:dTDP-4-dehydrorhamnose reductase
MKTLVLGSKGQLGSCLNDQLINSNYEVIFSSREQLDITNSEHTKNKILEISPELIINASAYTLVDKAEEDKDLANLINNIAVENIAKICNKLGCWLIHISTDYVFDGNSRIPYIEDDKTNPQGVYGESKLKGELAIQSSGCKHIIIRTAWVFSEYGNNFLKTMLRLGAERNELSIVRDQVGCPTYAQDIARTIIEIIPKLDLKKNNSLYHYCGDNPCSWYDFANAIFEEAKTNNIKLKSKINSIETSAYPMPAKRPKFSALDCSKIENEFGVLASNWHEGIQRALSKL